MPPAPSQREGKKKARRRSGSPKKKAIPLLLAFLLFFQPKPPQDVCKSHLVRSYNRYEQRRPQCLLRRLYLERKKNVQGNLGSKLAYVAGALKCLPRAGYAG